MRDREYRETAKLRHSTSLLSFVQLMSMVPLQWLLLAATGVSSSQAFVISDVALWSSGTGAFIPPSLTSSCNAPHYCYHPPPSPTSTLGGDVAAGGHHRRRSSSSPTALASARCWSTDSIIYDENGYVITTSGDDASISPSPRLWMEDIEQTEGRGGAYTVMRCEIVENPDNTDFSKDRYKWMMRDLRFHLKRLRTSYDTKYAQEEGGSSGDAHWEAEYLAAELESELSVVKMLDEAKSEMEVKTLGAILDGGDTIPVLMVTVLWTKETTDGSKDDEEQMPIRVRTHGSIASVPSPGTAKLPAAIQAAVALPPVVGGSSYQRDWPSLPNRHEHGPDAKDSSWCRERRPLEEMFKADGIGEVILARAVDADDTGEFQGLELLEGLTSNLFVVYRDGTLRTAAAEGNVLSGCARHRVLEAAEKVGLSYDETKPVLLQDAVDGLWSEVFVTSAIRLVIPVASLSVPEYEKDQGNDGAKILSFRKIWDATSSSVDAASTDEQGTDWATLTVIQLKDELRGRGLKVGGRKAELVQRLHEDEHDNGSEQGWTEMLYRKVILSYKESSSELDPSYFLDHQRQCLHVESLAEIAELDRLLKTML